MILSKYVIGTAIGTVLGASLYRHFNPTQKLLEHEKEEDENFTEIFFVSRPIDINTRLTRNLQLSPEIFKQYTDLLVYLIGSAQSSIQIAMYVFTSAPLGEALLAARDRGVNVCVVIDHSMKHALNSVIGRLKNAGIFVKVHEREPATTMHHKLCLIDVPYNENRGRLLLPTRAKATAFKQPVKLPKFGLTITGSLNWTGSGMQSNLENFIVTSDKNVCEASAVEFFRVWNEANPL